MRHSIYFNFFCRRSISAGLVLLVSAAVGCVEAAPPVSVPHDATLLFMGAPANFNGTRPAGSGRIYVVDQMTGQVVTASAVTSDQDVHLGSVDATHRFRVYFMPDASLKAAATTLPVQIQ